MAAMPYRSSPLAVALLDILMARDGFPEDERPVHLFIRQAEMLGKQRCGHFVLMPFKWMGRSQAVNDQTLIERVISFRHIEPEAEGNSGQVGLGRMGEYSGEFAEYKRHVAIQFVQVAEISRETVVKWR